MKPPKKKECKGHGKAKYFEGCGKMVLERTYGLCNDCRNHWAISTKEGEEWLKKRIIPRAKRKVSKEKSLKQKAEKDKIIDYSKKLQSKINEIARLIDIGLPCLARGYHANQIHGGHIFSRGAERSMRFNLHNIHRQGAQSNHFQNEDGLLREGLVNEYGKEYLDFLNSMRKCNPLKFSNLEYKELYIQASKISNFLKKEGKRFDLKQRIEIRNRINKDLGIYPDEFCVYHNHIKLKTNFNNGS